MDVFHDDPNVIDQKYLLRYDSFKEFIGKEEKVNLQSEIENDQIDTLDDILESSYQKINQSLADDILTEVLKLSPVAFEKMVLDLMEKMGYGTYSTTGRTNDEGIDGIIMEDKLGFNLCSDETLGIGSSCGTP